MSTKTFEEFYEGITGRKINKPYREIHYHIYITELAEIVAQYIDYRLDGIEAKILSTNDELGSVKSGDCSECGQHTRDWKSPAGSFAPEAWETLREHGIDPATGHKFSCSENKE